MAKDQENLRGWHLQIWETEWVFWGYGPDPPPMHCSPAEVVIHTPCRDDYVHETRIPFKLPEVRDPDHAPGEAERKKGWGWRFKSNDLCHDTGWQVAETREEALAQAAAEVAERKRNQELWEAALQDVREMSHRENIFLDILNSS
jgi:hypothetical protein